MPDLRTLDPIAVVAALVCGVVLGVGLGWVFHGSEAQPVGLTVTATQTTPGRPPPPPPAQQPGRQELARTALGGALRKAVREAKANGGRMEAAVMIDGASSPVVRPIGAQPQMRTWSMVKVVTALTLLERTDGGGDRGLDRFLQGAMLRSDNCAQRKLTLVLQHALGSEETRAAIERTVEQAGAQIDATASIDTDGAQECATPPYPEADRLSAQDAAPQPQIQLGTTRWGVRDAVRFMRALRRSAAGQGPYGRRAAQRLRRLMQAPKERSHETGADARITADPGWGAGKVFADPCWKVAYKAGWGGTQQQRFLAGQMGIVELARGHWAAFAVMFHPGRQPADDDPGKEDVDKSVEKALDTLKSALDRHLGGCRR